METKKIEIGTLELIIDAPFSEADHIIEEITHTFQNRFKNLELPYGLEIEKISIEKHCIKAKFLLVMSLLAGTPTAVVTFVKDYPKIKEGIVEIASDVRTGYDYIKDYKLNFDRNYYGPVKKGENLTLILRRLNIPQSEWKDKIQIILKLNPDAFIDGDPDRLKVGAVLKLQ